MNSLDLRTTHASDCRLTPTKKATALRDMRVLAAVVVPPISP
jgi:hypothetical protein